MVYNWELRFSNNTVAVCSVLSSIIVCIGAFLYIEKMTESNTKTCFLWRPLISLGDSSFGIYLCHMLAWRVFNRIIHQINIFPVNTLLVVVGSLTAVIVGHRILGKYSYLLGL